jgi:type II secretory pathway pseudopilin PulG
MLVAVAILGFIGVAFLTALATSSRSARILDEQVEAGELAQAQIAQVQKAAFNSDITCYLLEPNICYPPTVTPPPQYTISTKAEDILDPDGTCVDELNCNTLQKVTVTISRPSGVVFTMTTIKKK